MVCDGGGESRNAGVSAWGSARCGIDGFSGISPGGQGGGRGQPSAGDRGDHFVGFFRGSIVRTFVGCDAVW